MALTQYFNFSEPTVSFRIGGCLRAQYFWRIGLQGIHIKVSGRVVNVKSHYGAFGVEIYVQSINNLNRVNAHPRPKLNIKAVGVRIIRESHDNSSLKRLSMKALCVG